MSLFFLLFLRLPICFCRHQNILSLPLFLTLKSELPPLEAGSKQKRLLHEYLTRMRNCVEVNNSLLKFSKPWEKYKANKRTMMAFMIKLISRASDSNWHGICMFKLVFFIMSILASSTWVEFQVKLNIVLAFWLLMI